MLADKRAGMMQAEKVAGDLRDAHDAVAGIAVAGAGACPPRCAGWSGAPPQAPTLIEPAVKALDTALDRARRRARPSRCRVARGRSRSARARAHRGAAVRAARCGAQVQRAGRRPQCARRPLCRRSRPHRCRRRTARGAGSRRARGRGDAIARPRPRCPSGAGRRRTSSTRRSTRELEPLKLERAQFSTEIVTEPAGRQARTASTASNSGCGPTRAPGRDR